MISNKKELWIITNQFPFSSFGENGFLIPEIKALDGIFKKNKGSVRIIPLSVKNKFNESFDPDVFIVDKRCAGRNYSLSSFLNFIIGSIASGRLFICLAESIFHQQNIIAALIWEFDVWNIYHKLKKIIKNINNKDICLYSYWFLPAAAAIGLLRKRGFVRSAITRAHGYDLYESRLFHPCRSFDLENLDRVFPVSVAGTDYLKKKFPLHREKIECAYLGVGYGKFNLELSPRDSEIKICSCSSLIPLKRVHLIADAIVLFSRKMYAKKVSWVHYGDGPELERIQNIVSRIPDNLRVNLRGHVDLSVIANDYASGYHFFVNASTTEGLPVSIMEALSFSIPVVATDVGGNSEAVDDRCGCIVPKDVTAMELASAMTSLLADDAKYMSMRQAAWEAWKNKFDVFENIKLIFSENEFI